LVESEEVARRELLEEIGGRAAELHYVGQFYTSNGISSLVTSVYSSTGSMTSVPSFT
jgi:8-oxo-dGTP pyrophosphatase MutT (NUDIX family)